MTNRDKNVLENNGEKIRRKKHDSFYKRGGKTNMRFLYSILIFGIILFLKKAYNNSENVLKDAVIYVPFMM